jgi:HSP20 family protein
MLIRTDPIREFDRLAAQVFGTWTRPTGAPLTAFRDGERFVVRFDLPGVDPETIELDVERNVLSVRAQRETKLPEGSEVIADERVSGSYTRRLVLSDRLDTDRIEAAYDRGVLTVTIPVAEKAKARRIEITKGEAAVLNAA